MTVRAHHLQEDRLFDCYLAEQSGDALDPRVAEHLTDCADCRARYGEISSFLGGLRSAGDAEIDAIFSSEDLRAQQQQIAQRIEHLGHHARVISFPHHDTAGQEGHTSRVAPRWLAAAAAAGLFVGVGVSSFFQTGVRLTRTHQMSAVPAVNEMNAAKPGVAVSPSQAAEPVAAPALEPVDNNDDFLSELEFALERPRTQELLALDELTPRVRELTVSNRLR